MKVQSAYKSSKDKERALASYESFLSQWPVPYQARLINTSFGETHIIVSGSPQAKPLILLHGGGGNSTMWMYNIEALSKSFHVFAVDIIGEAGKSAGMRPSFKSEGHARWLKEVFDALGISKAVVCGASLGGMLAHQFALQYPQSVSSLVLLAPPSLFKMRPSFLFRAILASVFPTSFFARRFLHYISSKASSFSEEAVKAFIIQFQAYKPNMDAIPIISDNDLLRLPSKTLVMLGENEVIYNPIAVASRICSVTPSVAIDIIPGAKHTISVDQADLVNQKILQFLG